MNGVAPGLEAFERVEIKAGHVRFPWHARGVETIELQQDSPLKPGVFKLSEVEPESRCQQQPVGPITNSSPGAQSSVSLSASTSSTMFAAARCSA